MTKTYLCELCSKVFNQKIDYTRHKKKKTPCVSKETLAKIILSENNDKSVRDTLTRLFNTCMNIFRDSESVTGGKAIHDFTALVSLKIIDDLLEIDFHDHEYEYYIDDDEIDELMECTQFSALRKKEVDNLPGIMSSIWENVLSQHPKTCKSFRAGDDFNIKKGTTFKKLFKKLKSIDFSNVSIDILGHAYEELLKRSLVGRELGQYFTQPLIKDVMVELVNPQIHDDGTTETIFDPAMGTGGFLLTSLDHFRRQASVKKIDLDWKFICSKGLGGREAEVDTFQLANSNMLISSAHLFTSLEHGDSIRDPITKKYDIVLANPPFGIKGLKYDEITHHLRDKYIPIQGNSAVPLFLQAIISILKIGGRCAVVLPSGKELFGKSKAYVTLREYLMKTCDLKEILLLPTGLFINTTVKTCVAYFVKKKEGTDVVKIGGKKTRTYKFSKTHQTKNVKFYDYNPYEKVKNLLEEVDIGRIAENGYSLNYTEYLKDEEDEEEKYGGGVEWKTIGEMCKFYKKSKRKAREGKESGLVPFYTSSSQLTKYIDTADYTQESIIIGTGGNPNIKISSNFSCSTDNFILGSKVEFLLTKYLYSYIYNNINTLEKGFKGSTIKHISKDFIKGLKIPVPPLSVQQTIVDQLDFLYEQDIERTKIKIDDLKRKRKMIIEYGVMEAERKTLGEVCKINPESMKKGEWDSINYIDISSVGSGVINDIKKLTEKFPSRAKRKIQAGDTIYSTVRPNLRTYAYIEQDIEHGIASTGFAVVRPSELINSKYVSYVLGQKTVSEFLSSKATGAQYPAVSIDVIKSLRIPVPPLSVQQTIVKQCGVLDELISLLEREIVQSKELAKIVLDKSIHEDDFIILEDDD